MSEWFDRQNARENRSQWGYNDPTAIRNQMMQGMDPYLSGFSKLATSYGDRAQTSFDRSGELYGQSQGLLTGESPILAAMRKEQSKALSDVGSQKNRQIQETLAARGMGGGGMAGALGMESSSRLGEQARTGLMGIQKYGLEAGTQLGGMATKWGELGGGLMAGQGQATGAGAAMVNQGNQAYISQIQTNAANKASWLQADAARKRAQKSKRGGLLGGIVGGIGGFLLTGGSAQGAQLGYSLGSSFGS